MRFHEAEGFLGDPYPHYRRARREQPVQRDPETGTCGVFRYADVRACLTDGERLSSRDPQRHRFFRGAGLPPNMLSEDPPKHGRLRASLGDALRREAVEALEPVLRREARRLLAGGRRSDGIFDFVGDFTEPLASLAVCEVLGVPTADRERIRRWSKAIAGGLALYAGADEPPAEERELRHHVHREMAEYLRGTTPDPASPRLLPRLAGRLDAVDYFQMVGLLLVAGSETAARLLGNALLLLTRRPDLWRTLQHRPERVPRFLEEVLRYDSPSQATLRTVTRELTLGGVVLRRGDRVLLWLGSANRDPEVFPRADDFDPERWPNRHLAFGLGRHACPGTILARLEARVALEEVLAAWRSPGEPVADELPRSPTFLLRGVERLPLCPQWVDARAATDDSGVLSEAVS